MTISRTIALPGPGPNVKGPLRDYLITLVQELELELQARPEASEGVLYISEDQPLSLISPNGTLYRLSVDDGGNLVTEAQ